jgi:hypothetical protein
MIDGSAGMPRHAVTFAVLTLALTVYPGGTTAGAQAASAVTPYIQLGATQGYGGYEYVNRRLTTFSTGMNVAARPFGHGRLLLGMGYSNVFADTDLTAECRVAVRRGCAAPYPHFRLLSVDLGVRYPVKWVGELDFVLQPTGYRAWQQERWMFGPAATVAWSHRLWKSVAFVASKRGSYVASYEGQRLGLVNSSYGLRIW